MLYLKKIATIISFILAIFVSMLFALLRPRGTNHSYWFVKLYMPLYFKIWNIEIQFEDQHKLYKEKPAIYVANHQSALDTLYIGYFLPKGTVSLMKRSVLLIPIFGPYLWLTGHYFVKRSKKSSGQKIMKKIKATMIKRQQSVIIMPEGTRNQGKIGPFRKGVFKLAIETEIPIQPIVLSDFLKLDHTNNQKKIIFCKALNPYYTQDKTLQDLEIMMTQLRKEMLKTYVELNKKAEESRKIHQKQEEISREQHKYYPPLSAGKQI